MPDTTGDVIKSPFTVLYDKDGRKIGMIINWESFHIDPKKEKALSELLNRIGSEVTAILK